MKKMLRRIAAIVMLIAVAATSCAFAAGRDFDDAIKVSSISEGRVAFKAENGNWGFADLQGNTAVAPVWDYVYSYSEGFARVFTGALSDYGYPDTGVYGYIDMDGNILSQNWEEAGNFSDGLAYVCKNGKWGFIDTTGALVIPCEWDYAYSFSEGYACVFSGSLNKYGSPDQGVYSYIDRTGVVISEGWEKANTFAEGFASVRSGGKWGYIDTTGALAIPCEWDYYSAFSEGFARVFTGTVNDYGSPDEGVYSFIDTTGTVISSDWDSAGSFSDGMAYVCKNGKWGYIDVTGETVVPCVWDYSYSFSGGVGLVFVGPMNQYGNPEAENGVFHMLDTEGNQIGEARGTYRPTFHEGYAWLKQNGKYGMIDRNGNVILDFQWDDCYSYTEGHVLALKNGKWYIVNVETHLDHNGVDVNSDSFKSATVVYDFKQFCWGDTEAAVRAVEGTPDYVGRMNGTDANYIGYNTTAVGMDVILAYYFCDDGLFEVRYILTEEHSNENLFIDDYDAFRTAFTKKYGTPLLDQEVWDTDSHEEYYANKKGDALSYGFLSYITWYSTDTTDIYMSMSADNYDVTMSIEYVSKTISPGEADYSDDI